MKSIKKFQSLYGLWNFFYNQLTYYMDMCEEGDLIVSLTRDEQIQIDINFFMTVDQYFQIKYIMNDVGNGRS